MAKNNNPECYKCGEKNPDVLNFGTDPYQHDTNGDETEEWMCHDCREDALGDI